MLEIKNLCVNYGNLRILDDVSMEVKEGETVSLLGTNGSGKTTLVKTISCMGYEAGGSIKFFGEELVGAATQKAVELGIIQVPEGRNIFVHMTVNENLEMGAYAKRAKPKKKQNLEYVYSLFPELVEFAKTPAGNLSGGQQQMVAIARGLMADPKLLILDEPSVGLSPILTQRVFEAIKEICNQGVSVLITEQNIYDVLALAKRAYVLAQGRIVASDDAKALLNNEEIKRIYLGR
jgi:branched-chain amino acid transport system ATP-binding protein